MFADGMSGLRQGQTMENEAFDPYHKWLGIPPREQPANFYRLLSIELFESDPDVIAGAADRAMSHLRTFQAGPNGKLSQKLLNEISAARLALLTPDKKRAYDNYLKSQLAAAAQATQPVAQAASPVAPELDLNALEPIGLERKPAKRPAALAKKAGPAKRSPVAVIALAVVLVAVGVVAFATLASKTPDEPQQAKTDASAKAQIAAPAKAEVAPVRTSVRPASPPVASPMATSAPASSSPASPPVAPVVAPVAPPTPKRPAISFTPGKAVDLLSLIDLRRDVVAGDWQLQAGLLTSPKGEYPRLVLPGSAPANYRLTVRGVRLEGESLVIGLVIDGRQVILNIDTKDRTVSGLTLVDNQPAGQNFATQKVNDVLGENRPYQIVCEVVGEVLSVAVNNTPLLQWSGSSERLNMRSVWDVPEHAKDHLFLGSYKAVHQFQQLTLEPLAVAAEPAAPQLVRGPPGSIDLLANLYPVRDAVHGKWLARKARPNSPAALITPAANRGRLRIPGPVPDNYVLTVQGVREEVGSELALGLVVQGAQVVVLVAAGSGEHTRLEHVDGKAIHFKHASGKILPVGRPYTIQCTVRDGGIKLVVDNEEIFDWPGGGSLTLNKDWNIPATDELLIGNYGGVHRIEAMSLTPLPGAKFPPRWHAYLCDMPLVETSGLHPANLLRDRITVNQQLSPHGLYTHPVSTSEPARFVFDVGGKYRLFEGEVSIWDRLNKSNGMLTFHVVGDRRELWKSQPLQDRSGTQAFKVDVSGVKLLEIHVSCTDANRAQAVWIEPRLQ